MPPQQQPFVSQPYTTPGAAAPVSEESDKSFLAMWLFAWLLGYFGVDRFYNGDIGLGILKIVTLGGCGVWVLIDLILVLTGTRTDKQGRPFAGRQRYIKLAVILTVSLVALGILLDVVVFATGAFKSATGKSYMTSGYSQPAQTTPDDDTTTNN